MISIQFQSIIRMWVLVLHAILFASACMPPCACVCVLSMMNEKWVNLLLGGLEPSFGRSLKADLFHNHLYSKAASIATAPLEGSIEVIIIIDSTISRRQACVSAHAYMMHNPWTGLPDRFCASRTTSRITALLDFAMILLMTQCWRIEDGFMIYWSNGG